MHVGNLFDSHMCLVFRLAGSMAGCGGETNNQTIVPLSFVLSYFTVCNPFFCLQGYVYTRTAFLVLSGI